MRGPRRMLSWPQLGIELNSRVVGSRLSLSPLPRRARCEHNIRVENWNFLGASREIVSPT